MSAPGLPRALGRLGIAAAAAALGLVATHQLVALDLWWQLAAGEWIVEHGLPRVDPFSFGYPDRPWLEHRWLFFVAMHAIFERLGPNGLIAAKLVWLLGCFALLERAMRPSPAWARAVGLAFAVVLLHSRLKVRPELVTYLGVIGFIWAYERHRATDDGRWLRGLVPLQLVWSNAHTLWIAGPALAWAAWGVEATLARWPAVADFARVQPAREAASRRSLLRAAVAVTAASLVTPYLFLGELYPTTILEQIGVGSKLRELIVELQSPFALAGDPIFFGSYAAVVVASFATLLLPVRPPAFRIVLWAGFVGFSFLAARNVSLLGPVAGWVIARQLGDCALALPAARVRRLAWSAGTVAVVSSLALAAGALTDGLWRGRGWHQRFGTGVRHELYPIEAMAFVAEHGLPRPVLSGLGDASYLIYEGGERSVFLDGRLEVYGADEILANARHWSRPQGVLSDADRLGVDALLLDATLFAATVHALAEVPAWAPVFYDSRRVLFVRRAAIRPEQLATLEIDFARSARPRAGIPPRLASPDLVASWAPRVPDASEPFGRATLLLSLGARAAARGALEETVAIDPGHVEARLNLALLAEERGDESEARAHRAHVPVRRREALDVLEARVAIGLHADDPDRRLGVVVAALEAGSRSSLVVRELVALARDPRLAPRVEAALRAALAARPDGDGDDGPLRDGLRAVVALRATQSPLRQDAGSGGNRTSSGSTTRPGSSSFATDSRRTNR